MKNKTHFKIKSNQTNMLIMDQLVMYYQLLIKHTQYHIRPWTMDPAYVEHVCTTIYNNKFVKASFFFPKIIVESTHMHTLYINVSFDIICIVFHYIGQECFCKRFSSLLEHQCWKAIWGEVFSCEYTPEWSTGFKKGFFWGGEGNKQLSVRKYDHEMLLYYVIYSEVMPTIVQQIVVAIQHYLRPCQYVHVNIHQHFYCRTGCRYISY